MAGSGKVAVLATLMFAMLLSSSLVQAARPVVSEGSNVAADGSLMVRDPHSRQLRGFLWGHGGWGWPYGGWGGWGWGGWGWGWGRVRPVVIGKRLHSTRQLNTWGWRGWYGDWWGGWGRWNRWGWGGWWY